MAQASLKFDVRTLVKTSDLDDEFIQVVYDAVNRMVVLIGDIPFDRLFTMPIAELANVVAPRFSKAARMGLLDDASMVRRLTRELVKLVPEATVGDFFVQARNEVDEQVHTVLMRLRRHGVRIPLPVGDSRQRGARAASIQQLVKNGSSLSFHGLFISSGADLPKAAISAVRNARSLGLLSWFSNDRCCAKGAGDPGDVCKPNPKTWCNIPSDFSELCSIASDHCPSPPPAPDET